MISLPEATAVKVVYDEMERPSQFLEWEEM